MITDEQVKQLEKLGYESGVAFLVARDPTDPDSPIDKPVYYFRAADATHYLAEDEHAEALIAEGRPMTAKQVEKANKRTEREAMKEADVVEPEEVAGD